MAAFATPAALAASLRPAFPAPRLTATRPYRVARNLPRMHTAHPGPAPSASTRRRRPGEHKGFVEEMRFVAMRLHTKDQAPREGQQEASALPIDAWYPSKSHFMQFLVDSLAVYHYFETELVTPDSPHRIFSRFVNNGLERIPALQHDIAYLNTLGVETPQPTVAATRYVQYLRDLLEDKPESVLCHWYNYYFAHSAGGRMIGRLMQDRLFWRPRIRVLQVGNRRQADPQQGARHH
ncbi:Heme oxygenase 1, chloroplastic [Gracilariopsis chorda]|uniref:Heme oxygenase 1, chloroplastic n=1 Tax=Gracilariopsis chorda TaxID=448386 RepID=A0A2V3J3E4_9FLOR|nr:Heme oxygenase 1, chloroplastic [Gracilariopsis chorda]|eukprot:PXF48928.1 Heme oxygenase 1, chloroplastic [Gracilariopsis chorda]